MWLSAGLKKKYFPNTSIILLCICNSSNVPVWGSIVYFTASAGCGTQKKKETEQIQ